MQVNATILEARVGGLYDSTNIVPHPVTTGVSALGLDHVNVLGKTIKEVMTKAGFSRYPTCHMSLLGSNICLLQEGVPAFSVDQSEEGMEMLKQWALELQVRWF